MRDLTMVKCDKWGTREVGEIERRRGKIVESTVRSRSTKTQGGVNSQEKENTDTGEGGRVESTVRSRSTLTQGKEGEGSQQSGAGVH